MKTIVGYVRSIPGGVGISGVPVSIRLLKDGTLVPVGGMAQASVNPVNTDANGRFEWSCELSPGPVKVEAAIDSGAELKVRVGEEVMQAGDIYISDIPTMGQMFTNGVIDDVDNKLAVAAVTGSLQVTVATGAANFNGRVFQTHTARTLNIDPNTTLANRIDVVYAEHIRTGVDAGKQSIGIVKGTVSGVVPTLTQPAGTVRIALANVTIPQSATSTTVANIAPLAAPTHVNLDAGSVKLINLATEVRDKLTDQMFTITSPTTGQHLAYNGSKWINENNLISAAEDVAIASPVAGQVLTYDAGEWKNLALPAAPTVSIAAAADTSITSPANNSVLTWNAASSRWIDQALPAPPVVSIAAATDTDITTPANNSVLTWNAASSKWIDQALPAPPVVSIAAATDTSITSPANNSVLTWNAASSRWIDQALPAPPTVSIAAATDSVITSPANGQFLVYSSSRWRNATLDIDIPSSKFAQSIYNAYGNLPANNTLLASCAVTVPAGTWLLKVEAMGQYYGINVGGGTNNFWFQGNAVDGLSLAHTQIAATSDQGVDRMWTNSCGRVVTVASTTTFTADLWVSGGNIYLRGGKIMLSAL